MCSIAGFCNFKDDWKSVITKMNNRMFHRGPDRGGIWSNKDNCVVFGHRRLSILELSRLGAQPMESHSKNLVITYNGEIYNFKELEKALLCKESKIKFEGRSDTEILLEYIDVYGVERALTDAKGMFAFALYDKSTENLWLARDRMGEKPLYYGFINGSFVFASDIAALQYFPGFTNEIDREALTLYFRYGYFPAPYTVFKNINKLEAGCFLQLKKPYTIITQCKYWDIMEVAKRGQNNLFKGTELEAADELERLLTNSIKQQMIADVPVGAFLSGGVDSSTVAAIMQAVSENKIKTFSIGFNEEGYNEAQFAKVTAHYLGTEHEELYVSVKNTMEIISQLPYIYGEPFADSSQIPTCLVSRLAKKQVTVSLSGDGGDELFYGYNSYFSVPKVWNKISYIPYPIRKLVQYLLKRELFDNNVNTRKIKYYIGAKSIEDIYKSIEKLTLNTDNFVIGSHIPEYKYSAYPHKFLDKEIENNMALMDMLMYLPDDILTKVDRASMAVSLEARIPMLDRDLIEFSWQLPLSIKAGQGSGKKILKNVLYRYIPPELIERPKKGFGIPVVQWMRTGQLKEWVEDMFCSSTIKRQGLLNNNIIQEVWRNFKVTGEGGSKLWYLFIFQLWMEQLEKNMYT